MSEVRFKLIIDGKQVDAVLDNTEDQLKHIKRQSQTVTEKFANWSMIVTGINQGMQLLRQATQFIGEAIDAYKLQEQAEKQLEVALERRSESLLKYASAMQSVTTHGDEEIIKAQALAAAFTKDEEQIKRLTKAALDLADAKGMELVTSMDLLVKTYGSSTNALSRYGLQVEGAAKSSERLESVVNSVNEVFADQAEALAQTDTGKIAQAYNQMGDNLERVGEVAAKVFAPLIQMTADAGTAIFDWLLPVKSEIDKLTESAMEQRTELEMLSGRYLELAKKTKLTKEQQVIWNNTIKSLNDKYPNYLKNVNLYKDSYEKVKKALDEAKTSLDKYTQSLIRKAVLEKLQKQLAEITAVIVANEAKKLDYATVTQEKISAMEGYYGKERAKGELESRQKLWTQLANREIEIAKQKAEKIKEEIAKTTKIMNEMFGDAVAPKTFTAKVNVEPSQTSIDKFGNLVAKGLEQAPVKMPKYDFKYDDKFRIEAMEEGLQKELELNEYYREQELQAHEQNQLEKYYINQLYDQKRRELEEQATQDRIALEYESTLSLLGAMNELFEHSKGISYAMAIISTYEAFNAALAMKPWSPANYFFAAAALVKGFAQAKKISEQKPPKAETGGWVGGNSHSSGGTIIEAERDEFIVNKNSALKNAALLEAINSDRVEELRSGTIQAMINVQSNIIPAAENKKLEDLFNKHFEKLDKWQKEFTFKQKGEDLYAVNEIQSDKNELMEF